MMAQDALATIPRMFAERSRGSAVTRRRVTRSTGRSWPSPTLSSIAGCARLPWPCASAAVRPGELVALVSDNRPEWLVCALAIQSVGAVDVPRGSDTPAEILKAILAHAQPSVVIFEDRAQVEKVVELLGGLRAAVVIDAPEEAPGVRGRRRASASSVACPLLGLDELLAYGESLLEARGAEVDGWRAAVAPDDLASVIYTWGRRVPPRASPSLTATSCSTSARSPCGSGRSRSASFRSCRPGTPTNASSR